MSLSKYYESTDDFQPEEIVKTPAYRADGWRPEQNAEQKPFEAQQITSPPPQKSKVKPEKKVAEKKDKISPPPPPEPEPPAPPKEPEPPPPPPIDMSKYILIEEAEARASEQFAQGVEEGLAKAASDYGSAADVLSNICDQLDSLRETIINNSSSELQNFALAIAEKIIRTSVSELDQTIVKTVGEALQRAVKSDAFTIFVNPEDYEIINEKSSEIVAGINGLNNIIIKTDPTREKGGAKIESDNCIIDATIASQFELIREEISRTAG